MDYQNDARTLKHHKVIRLDNKIIQITLNKAKTVTLYTGSQLLHAAVSMIIQ